MLRILLIDDEPSIRLTMGDALRSAGHDVVLAADGELGLNQIAKQSFDLVITDIRLPKVDGLSILHFLRNQHPHIFVVLITAYADVRDAVTALKDGAYDYLMKPFDPEELILRVKRIDDQKALRLQLEHSRISLTTLDKSPIVGMSRSMEAVKKRIETISSSDAAVLILGESGTGKELVALSVHETSPRSKKPFVAVNCAAFPETLLEAELFGHERGAFTGAVKKRQGRFEAAHGGTLFLDEIAEIPPPAQAKLLRAIQEGQFEPLGTNTPTKVDVRIISATNKNLKERIANGQFREDLYYRLNVLDIQVPPLRERKDDLPLLVEYFMRRLVGEGQRTPRLTPRAWAALSEYRFPGNVRELEHTIQHAYVISRGEEIDLEHLPSDIAGVVRPSNTPSGEFRSLNNAVKEFEKEYLVRALRAAEGKKTLAAEMLGISRKNLWQKLRAYGLTNEEQHEF